VAVITLARRTYPDMGERDQPTTRFSANIVEVIAGSRAKSVNRESEIVVARTGGVQYVRGTAKLVEESRFPAWDVGKTCLVFLKWSDHDHAYVLPYGPDSSFELDSNANTVRTFGRGTLAGQKRGRPFANLLIEVRATAR
jgi:hypothetical protein